MIDYLKDKNMIFVMIFFITLIIVINNTSRLSDSFSFYLEHSKKIEPSMLQVRMSQYKRILKQDNKSNATFEKQLIKILR